MERRRDCWGSMDCYRWWEGFGGGGGRVSWSWVRRNGGSKGEVGG